MTTRPQALEAVAARRLRPFSNGSQDLDWTESNCVGCGKYNPDDPKPGRCDISDALTVAYFDDGTVSAEIARRMGATDHRGHYNWPCPERDRRHLNFADHCGACAERSKR